MNVRFFTGTRAEYDSLPSPRNPLGLYFCSDTNELFWADRLLTDGMRVVPTHEDLPEITKAADGVVYYVTETRNGYTLSPDRKEWLQTIYAPATDAYRVPESEYYNTVTTVGAVRDIENRIYSDVNRLERRIANIEVGTSESGVEAIYFAGVKLDKLNGTHTIDRLCALRALGFVIPEDQEEFELVTKDYVDSKISSISGLDNYYTKAEVDDLIPETPTKVSQLENDRGYITSVPDEYITEAELNSKNYLTEHQSLTNYATKEFVTDAINNIKLPEAEKVDLSAYALKSEVKVKANDIPFTTNKYVSRAIGDFTVGESVKGLTVAELFAKLLGLTSMPQGVVDDIIANELGLYQFNDSVEVEYVDFTRTIFETEDEHTSAPTESAFYQCSYTDNEGKKITESGYQHITEAQDNIWYMVMLPSTLTIGENVKVQSWVEMGGGHWSDGAISLECDPEVIAANFAEADLAMPTIPEGYTMWVDFNDTNPGIKLRYIING